MGEVVPAWVVRLANILEWVVPRLWKEGPEIRQRIRVGLTLERDNRAYVKIDQIFEMVSELRNLARVQSGIPDSMSNNGLGNLLILNPSEYESYFLISWILLI